MPRPAIASPAILLCGLGLCGLGVASPAQTGGAQAPLFLELDDEALAAADLVAVDSGERLVRINRQRLEDARTALSDGKRPRLLVNLADATLTAIVERAAPTTSGYALSGRFAGGARGGLTLVVNGDIVVGSVWTPVDAYDIRTVAAGVCAIRKADPAKGLPLADPLAPPAPPGRPAKTVPADATAGSAGQTP